MDPKPAQPPTTTGVIRGVIAQTGENSIIAPTNLVQTVYAARSSYEYIRLQNLSRMELFAAIEGVIQGNPPYDPTELAQNGLGHIANFNNGDATAQYEKGALVYWNLLNFTEFLAKFTFYDTTDPDSLEYAEIMARNFDLVVREWPSFIRHFCCLSAQLVKFGYTALMWPDERDWRWKPIETARLFFPDQVSTDEELLTLIYVESNFTVQYLYQVYEQFKDKPADKSPWNCEVLASYLLYRANRWGAGNTSGTFTSVLNMMDLQTMVQNNDVFINWFYSDEVRLVTLLQQEYTGKYSHYIFDRFFTQVGGSGTDGFLFFISEQYDSLSEAFALFTASPGVFTIHSNRGLGHKIFAPCQATMQLDCDIVNMARLSSTPFIETPNIGASNFESITVRPGVPTIIGGAKFAQNNLGSNISQLVGANGYLLNKLQNNLTNSGSDPQFPDSNVGSISDSQARRQDYREQGVLKNSIAHFYTTWDRVLQTMLKKGSNSKVGYPGHDTFRKWKELCIEQGVPEVIFSKNKDGDFKYFFIKASRVAGDGSTLGLMTGLQTVAPFAGEFTAKGGKQYARDTVRTALGPDYVAAYLGNEEPDEMAGGASLAQLENNAMQQGQPARFSPDNEQRPHIVTHFQLGKQLVEARMQEQMTATDADHVFSVLMPHLGEHIQFTAKSPLQAGFIASIKDEWNQLRNYAQLNRKNAEAEQKAALEQQQKDAEATQQVMSDEQRKDFQAQKAEARSDYKVQAQVERADKANETRAEVQKTKIERDSANQNLKVRLDAANKAEEVALDAAAELERMGGATISPTDIEGIPNNGRLNVR